MVPALALAAMRPNCRSVTLTSPKGSTITACAVPVVVWAAAGPAPRPELANAKAKPRQHRAAPARVLDKEPRFIQATLTAFGEITLQQHG
jgi:hypothetical protein